MKCALVAVAVAVFVTGCGGGGDGGESKSPYKGTPTTPTETTTVRVYFLRDGKVWPAARDVETPGVANAALAELLEGPTEQEETELELTTAIPEEADSAEVSIANGVALVELDVELPDEPLAQLVYTLTQFPTVEAVEIQERTLTRADFEDLTPSVLVESPLSFEEVTSPLHATGTANTFEATFSYEVTDTDGRIVAEDFVTATSGTGTRGTFDFTSAPFTVPFDGVGSLIVFELSAKDGSRINIVEIPLKVKK